MYFDYIGVLHYKKIYKESNRNFIGSSIWFGSANRVLPVAYPWPTCSLPVAYQWPNRNLHVR